MMSALRNPFFSRQRIVRSGVSMAAKGTEALYSAIATHQCRSVVGERKLGKSPSCLPLPQPATMERFGLDPARIVFLYLLIWKVWPLPGARILGEMLDRLVARLCRPRSLHDPG